MKKSNKKSSWQECLSYGHKIELMVLDRIKDKYPKAFMTTGKYSYFDIYIPEIKKSVEVKSDKMSNQTGNLVIEISYGDNPSALSVTKADYWVFYDANKLIWITPENIRRAIKESNARLREFIGGSDIVSKKAYLIKKQTIQGYADLINELK